MSGGTARQNSNYRRKWKMTTRMLPLQCFAAAAAVATEATGAVGDVID